MLLMLLFITLVVDTILYDFNPICLDKSIIRDNLQNPDGVRGSRTLLPSSDDNNIVSSPDEVAPLAKVDGVLDPVVDVLHPVGVALLLVQQWDAASEDLHLSRHLSVPLQTLMSMTSSGESKHSYIPCNREDGTVRLVLWDNVGGCSGSGEDNDGRSLALVGSQNCTDGSRWCVVKPFRLLFSLLYHNHNQNVF